MFFNCQTHELAAPRRCQNVALSSAGFPWCFSQSLHRACQWTLTHAIRVFLWSERCKQQTSHCVGVDLSCVYVSRAWQFQLTHLRMRNSHHRYKSTTKFGCSMMIITKCLHTTISAKLKNMEANLDCTERLHMQPNLEIGIWIWLLYGFSAENCVCIDVLSWPFRRSPHEQGGHQISHNLQSATSPPERIFNLTMLYSWI